MRRSVTYAAGHDTDEALEFERQMMNSTGATDDHRAAVAAAVAQRRTDEAPQATSSPAQPSQPSQSSGQPGGQQSARPATPSPRPAPRQVEFDDDDLDVPDFLK